MCEKLTANIIPGGEKLKDLLLDWEQRQACPLATSIQCNTRNLARIIRQKKGKTKKKKEN